MGRSHANVTERATGRVLLARLESVATPFGTDWLGDDEAGRLQAMASPQRRRSFLAGHWLARQVASDWLRVDARRIALQRHHDGRPQLHVDGMPTPLSLSLSHSGDWLACAIATVAVGIDVELPRRQRDLDALARFAFSPDEVERLQRLPPGERSAAFHVLWTLKEARGKRTGEGLLPGQSRRVTTLPSDAASADAASWILDDGALALAIDAGTEIAIEGGETLASPLYWRYSNDR